jgi:xylulokinase
MNGEAPDFLAIDVGTSSLKAVLYAKEGAVLGAATRRYSYASPQPGWAESDPEDWWKAFGQALADLQAQHFDMSKLEAIAFTGQMHTAVLLDDQGSVIPPTILWLDRRAAAETEELQALFNLPPYQINSTYTLPKLLWLSRHRPEVMARVRSILWPKDFMRYRLTGVLFTDPTEPGGAALMDWDTRSWAPERLAVVGLEPSVLPPIHKSHTVVGNPLPEVARTLRINPRAQVLIGIGDVAALIGGAPPRPGRVVCSMGSSSMTFMALAAGQHPGDAAHRLYTYPLDPYRLLGGVSSTTGAALVWAFNNVIKTTSPSETFETVMAEAAALQPGAGGVCFIPYLAGERTPYWSDEIRGGFYGLQLAHDRRHLIRAIMEGIAFSLRHLLDLYFELGAPVTELVLAGGGTKTPGLCQIIADACGRDVAIYAEEETVTRVLYALYRVSLYGDDLDTILSSTFPAPEIIRRDQDCSNLYEPGFATYRRFAAFAFGEARRVTTPQI